ncbi:hypothetical protein NE237_033058 [Protea cynaroides]|uniref:Vomeronasal type-1 receptor n=1 Tax=Protea cynaroides TaxID=273540 RepID=A0A9Q0L624_9MAGN|nr:hypothetical protein NE237_033058 [Protea cynaroides]
MFLLFALLMCVQLAISSKTKETSLSLPQPSVHYLIRNSLSENLLKLFSNLLTAISEVSISSPLIWVVASIAMVPDLWGTIFCHQTHCLKIDSSIIGMSKVIGQLILLSAAVLYDWYWKTVPMKKLIGTVQIVYAVSLVLDFVLLKQINLKLGIPNEAYVLCMSGLGESIAQFKLLPFSVLFANLCPPGSEDQSDLLHTAGQAYQDLAFVISQSFVWVVESRVQSDVDWYHLVDWFLILDLKQILSPPFTSEDVLLASTSST